VVLPADPADASTTRLAVPVKDRQVLVVDDIELVADPVPLENPEVDMRLVDVARDEAQAVRDDLVEVRDTMVADPEGKAAREGGPEGGDVRKPRRFAHREDLTARGGDDLADQLRQLLGYKRLPSLLFDVSMEGGEAVFRGRGSGHGVGLCQWGARGRAMRGGTYREILAHYYPGAELRRMY